MNIPRPPARRRQLGLTALIDVVFILLLFFMLASTFIEWRSVTLTVAAGESATAKPAKPIVIKLLTGGGYEMDGEAMSIDDIAREVGVVTGVDPEQGFLLQPRNDVPLQRIVALLDRISAAGGKNVILVREQAAL